MRKTAFEKISICSAFESFLVFLTSGFFVVIIGDCFIDLAGDLPDWYLSLIQEPISIAHFFLLSVGSLVVTAIVTWCGTKNHNEKWWFEKILLPPSRAGISCGFIASGMLIGIGSGLFIVTRGAPETELAHTSVVFISLGIYCLAIVYPVSLLMLYLINQEAKHSLVVDFLGAIYFVLMIFSGYKFREHVDVVSLGASFSVLIIYACFGRRWRIRNDKKAANANS
ncbi:hypothetical protein [Billgrantia antri]|uniref:Uncharacterized protein n=1 Tax=Billgrantia antri TaxID=2846777 RepID=A0ABS6ZLQ4_9GAMM|nr:hypothetical protein [Halomonas antri]MBW6391001.1 hypothetical protein [Halomonas antri]